MAYGYNSATVTSQAASTVVTSAVPKEVFAPGGSAYIASTGANAVTFLPKSSTVAPFAICSLHGSTGFEVRTQPGSSDLINGVNASTGKEMACAAGATVQVWKRADKQYVAFHVTSVGAMGSTEATSPVPD